MSRYASPLDQFFDNFNKILVNGQIDFFESGTNIRLDTYQDEMLSILNTNPVILDGAGRPPNIWLQDLQYKIRLSDQFGVLIAEIDPNNSLGSDAFGFSLWSASTIYNTDDIVKFNGKFYQSLVDGNTNNDPSATPTAWSEITFITVWNPNEAYDLDQTVRRNGMLYASTTNGNTGNDPATDSANWKNVAGKPAIGQVNLPGTPGTITTVTGLPFRPRLVEFHAAMSSAATYAVTSHGWADGTSNVCTRMTAGATFAVGNNTDLWRLIDPGGTLENGGDLLEFTDDGFSVQSNGFTDTPAIASFIAYP